VGRNKVERFFDPPMESASSASDFILPKRGKKRRNNRQELSPLSLSAKIERERLTLLKDDAWLQNTLRLSSKHI
jgi:hypothetical protein